MNNINNDKMKHKFNILNSINETKNKIYYISSYHSDNYTMKQEIEQPKNKNESTSKIFSISMSKVENDTIEHDSCSYKYQF